MHSYVRTSKLKTKEGSLLLILFMRGWAKPMLPYNIPSKKQRWNNVAKMSQQRCNAVLHWKSLLRIVPCTITLNGNKSHKLWLLVVMKFPQPLFFFLSIKAKESTFVSVFVFVCLLFFLSFFFQKRSGMLREGFFLK